VSVSELAGDSSVVLSGNNVSTSMFVPSLRLRSASATVELGDGQTMGLAGLLDDKLRTSVTKFPGLGDIPVLGALFRSNDYQKGQTELVILVTPHLAKPVAPGSIKLPTDSFVEPSDADFYLWGRTEGTAKATSSGHQVSPSDAAVTGVDPDYANNVVVEMRKDVPKPEDVRKPINIQAFGTSGGW
jgi:pilus assembly protein CpaC